MKKKLIILALVLAMTAAIAACGPGDTPGPAGVGQGTTPGGERVEITVAFGLVPNSLDPIDEDINTTISICFHIFDTLFALDYRDFSWIPSVAKSWNQIDDITWEFEINLDHVFHNGDPLTMEDVVYSITRLGDFPKSVATFRELSEVYYIAPNTLRVILAEPNNTTIEKVNFKAIIVNKAYIAENGPEAIFLRPIGTGPFKLTEFTPGTSVTIETWDGYPFQRPQIDVINFIAIPENANRFIAVETGLVHYAGLVSAFEFEQARRDGSFNLFETLSLRSVMLSMNVEKPPLDNPVVRQAFAHALDRESMSHLAGGRPMLQSSLFGGFPDFYQVSPYFAHFDIDKARELFESAGISPANPLDIEILYFNPDPAIELFQSTLRPLGVNLVATQLEFSVYLARQAANEYEICWSNLRNTAGSALMDLERFDSNFIGMRNIARYNCPEMDALIAKARVVYDPVELRALVTEINDRAARSNAYIPIFIPANFGVMDSRLSGVTINGLMLQCFRNATFTP